MTVNQKPMVMERVFFFQIREPDRSWDDTEAKKVEWFEELSEALQFACWLSELMGAEVRMTEGTIHNNISYYL